MEVPIIQSPEQKELEIQQKVQQFSNDLSHLLQQAILEVPLHTVMKVVANHQVDLNMVYVNALMQQFQAGLSQEALSAEPTPES